jgi:membrane-associated phospholipid phosphatase
MSTTELGVLTVPSTWDRRLAQMVSVVASPPLIGATAVALIAATLATTQTWTLAALYLALTIVLPLGFIGWLARQGRISDLDLSVRQERIAPLSFTLAVMGLGWLLLHYATAPLSLLAFAALNVAQVALFLFITLFWKISMHTAAVAALAVLAGFVIGKGALLLFWVVPLVAWARLRLRRHTLGQTIAGALLGALMCLLVMHLYGV